MKNLALVMSFLFLFTINVHAIEESTLVIPESSALSIDYVEVNQDALINVDNMKRANKIKEAELKAQKNKKKALKVDSEGLIHQRALDYTTKRTNATIPILR